MNLKKTLACLTALTLTTVSMAQTRMQQVESPIVSEKDSSWYKEQKNLWKAETEKDPTNETAWDNYYRAARYMGWWGNRSDTLARQAIQEMSEAIPDTYTYNHCAYCAIVGGHGLGNDGDEFAEKAIAMLPEKPRMQDFDTWVCFLAMKGYEQRMAQMAKRYFESGLYSEAVLRYSYNELQGMDDGSIFISTGDAAIIPKWLIQEGMGLHKDKIIVCSPFLAVKEYREWLFKKLGMEVPEWTEGTYDSYEQKQLQAIIDRYGSKVYFSATTPQNIYKPWKKNLYNEGLLLKYSAKPYDNLAVKRRNAEEQYLLEYLLVPFRPDWTAGQRLSANYAILFADLLPYYAKHNQRRYDWLMKLLVSGIDNTSMSEEQKQYYRNSLLNVEYTK